MLYGRHLLGRYLGLVDLQGSLRHLQSPAKPARLRRMLHRSCPSTKVSSSTGRYRIADAC